MIQKQEERKIIIEYGMKMNNFVCHSGGCPGADITWENEGLKYEKITEKEYKESIRQKLKQQFKEEIERLYKRIEETKREEELILSKYC